jgi:hypothetical protein
MNELEKRKLKYDIVFYHMEGCHYSGIANTELDPQIKSGIIGKFAHTDKPPPGVQGFPHFVNNKNGKTVTGWPGSEKELFIQLDYIKEGYNVLDSHLLPHKRKEFPETFEMENFPSYNVGGYSKLSNCWVKQPNYTA